VRMRQLQDRATQMILRRDIKGVDSSSENDKLIKLRFEWNGDLDEAKGNM
jgi:hypothetical protein